MSLVNMPLVNIVYVTFLIIVYVDCKVNKTNALVVPYGIKEIKVKNDVSSSLSSIKTNHNNNKMKLNKEIKNLEKTSSGGASLTERIPPKVVEKCRKEKTGKQSKESNYYCDSEVSNSFKPSHAFNKVRKTNRRKHQKKLRKIGRAKRKRAKVAKAKKKKISPVKKLDTNNMILNPEMKMKINVNYEVEYKNVPENIKSMWSSPLSEGETSDETNPNSYRYGMLAAWQLDVHKGKKNENDVYTDVKEPNHDTKHSSSKKRRKKHKKKNRKKSSKTDKKKTEVKSPEQLAIELVNKVHDGATEMEHKPENLELDLCLKWRHVEKFLESERVFPLLPSCPCVYPIDLVYKEYIYDQHKKLSYRWRVISNESELVMHRGASTCMRSATLEHHNTLAAQVCCYDSQRNLITRGMSAGFPLRVSPDASPGLHRLFDYNAWKKCQGNFHRLHVYRKPNNVRNCKRNPSSNQYKLMIQQAYDY